MEVLHSTTLKFIRLIICIYLLPTTSFLPELPLRQGATASSASSCPVGCECKRDTLDDIGPIYSVYCKGMGLTKVPDLSSLKSRGPSYNTVSGHAHVDGVDIPVQLDLSDNKIEAIEESDFIVDLNIYSLDLSRNKKLSNISEHALHNLAPSLRVLSVDAIGLMFNQPVRFVSNLYMLEQLSLKYNNRRGYAVGAVDKVIVTLLEGPVIKSLKSLTLSHCGIRSLSNSSLNGLHSLETLDLSKNWFLQTPAGIFSAVPHLETLSLFHCYITKLADYDFQPLKRLHNLDLSSNRIATIEPHAFVGQEEYLKQLLLHRNHLDQIPTAAMRWLKKLKQLDLSENRFSSLSNGDFQGEYCLEELLISATGMVFESSAFATQSKCIVDLTIKQMDLKTVPRLALMNLKNLRKLSLDNNMIETLPDDAFSGLSANSIRLAHNPLTTIADHAFRGLPPGLVINLRYTHVSDMLFLLGYPDEAIASVNLDYANLQCSCSMREAINVTLTVDIYGSCRSESRDVVLNSRELNDIVEEACRKEREARSTAVAPHRFFDFHWLISLAAITTMSYNWS